MQTALELYIASPLFLNTAHAYQKEKLPSNIFLSCCQFLHKNRQGKNYFSNSQHLKKKQQAEEAT